MAENEWMGERDRGRDRIFFSAFWPKMLWDWNVQADEVVEFVVEFVTILQPWTDEVVNFVCRALHYLEPENFPDPQSLFHTLDEWVSSSLEVFGVLFFWALWWPYQLCVWVLLPRLHWR